MKGEAGLNKIDPKVTTQFFVPVQTTCVRYVQIHFRKDCTYRVVVSLLALLVLRSKLCSHPRQCSSQIIIMSLKVYCVLSYIIILGFLVFIHHHPPLSELHPKFKPRSLGYALTNLSRYRKNRQNFIIFYCVC